MKNIKIKKDEFNPESVELLAKSIIQVAEGTKKIFEVGLNQKCLIVLIQAMIGGQNITQSQIKLVLEGLPRLKAWYIRQ